MIKILSEVGIGETHLNLIKAIYDKPKANIILNDKKLKPFLLRSGKDKDAHSLHFNSIFLNYWR